MNASEANTSHQGQGVYRSTIHSWDDWFPLTKLLSFGYVFRGHSDETWSIESALYRATKNLGENDRYELERLTLLEFQRRAHHYLPCTPPADDRLSWLALMQHHGAPTRLVDFTHSFHVGTYFALERSGEMKNDACVFAIRKGLLDDRFLGISSIRSTTERQEHQAALRKNFSDNIGRELASKHHAKGIFFGEGEWLSERMSVQQGVFLAAHTLQSSFNENFYRALQTCLDEVYELPLDQLVAELRSEKSTMNFNVLKLVFDSDVRSELLSDLASSNVSAASLFPGLDGFARGLNTLVHTATYEDAMLKDIILDEFGVVDSAD